MATSSAPFDVRDTGSEAWNIFVFEFLGTSLFVYGCACSQISVFDVSLCYFGVLTLFGRLSGGHFNPCVSLSLLLQSQIDFKQFLNYVIAQFVGALLAGFLCYLYIDMNWVPYFQEHPIEQLIGTFVGELLGATLFLLFAQIQMIKDTAITTNAIASFVFLSAIFYAAREFTIVTSHSLFNPAAALSLTLAQSLKRQEWRHIDNLWVFMAGPAAASILAAILYTRVYVPSKRR